MIYRRGNMQERVAVDKFEIYKLMRLKKYKDACLHLKDVRNVIEIATRKRINQFIKEKIIFKDEEELFFKVIYNNFNNKLLEDNCYALMNEEDLECVKKQIMKFSEAKNKNRRRYIKN
jgi:hypothetical protein